LWHLRNSFTVCNSADIFSGSGWRIQNSAARERPRWFFLSAFMGQYQSVGLNDGGS
jgi:hypothetical protein